MNVTPVLPSVAFEDPADLAYAADVDAHHRGKYLVDREGHMAMPSASALAKNPSLSVVRQVTLSPNETYKPPAPPDATVAMLKAADVPAEVVRGALAWINSGPTQTEEQLATLDAEHTAQVATELGAMWGDKFESNKQAISAYLKTLKPEHAELVSNARMPDGRAILNDPANLQRLLGLATRARPNTSGDIGSDIASIEKFMRSNRAAYNRDEALQARYRELIARRDA